MRFLDEWESVVRTMVGLAIMIIFMVSCLLIMGLCHPIIEVIFDGIFKLMMFSVTGEWR